MLVIGATGGPGFCSRTGRDAPQIDPRRRDLRTMCLTGAQLVGSKHPANQVSDSLLCYDASRLLVCRRSGRA